MALLLAGIAVAIYFVITFSNNLSVDDKRPCQNMYDSPKYIKSYGKRFLPDAPTVGAPATDGSMDPTAQSVVYWQIKVATAPAPANVNYASKMAGVTYSSNSFVSEYTGSKFTIPTTGVQTGPPVTDWIPFMAGGSVRSAGVRTYDASSFAYYALFYVGSKQSSEVKKDATSGLVTVVGPVVMSDGFQFVYCPPDSKLYIANAVAVVDTPTEIKV